MKKIIASLLLALGVTFSGNAQLANGSIAPDFNLTDINGNTHHLYDYLSQGKAVIIELFACHCPTCWNYHLSGRLDSLNELYGPTGTNQIVTLMIEYDELNGPNEFDGTGGWTAGDWITGNSVPMINVEGADRSIFDDYDLAYFTQIYKICPDKTTELMFTYQTVSELFQAADDCAGALSIEEEAAVSGTIHVDYSNHQLVISDFEHLSTVTITNSIGLQIKGLDGKGNQSIDISMLNAGIYFVQIVVSTGTLVKKILVP
jgi:hypothetical protein